ncbi:MAG: type II toxin-antitoxin system HicB family antitoxin [Methanoregula sp.]
MKDKGDTCPAKKYNIVIEPGDDGWYVVTVPALHGCITQRKTVEEAESKRKGSNRSIP